MSRRRLSRAEQAKMARLFAPAEPEPRRVTPSAVDVGSLTAERERAEQAVADIEEGLARARAVHRGHQ